MSKAVLPEYIVSNQKIVAVVFNKSIRSIQRWASEGMPVRSDGRYDLSEIYLWRAKIEAEEREKESQNKWKDDHEKWKAKQAEVRYQKMIGELVSAEEVKEERIKRILVWKRQMMQLPHVLAPKVEGMTAREAQVVINDHINTILDRFSAISTEAKRGAGKRAKNTSK